MWKMHMHTRTHTLYRRTILLNSNIVFSKCWQSHPTKPADRNACTVSVFSGHLLPLLGVPFKPTFAVKQMTTDEGCGPSRHNDRSKNNQKTLSTNWKPSRSNFTSIIACQCISCLFVAWKKVVFAEKCADVLYRLIKINFFQPCVCFDLVLYRIILRMRPSRTPLQPGKPRPVRLWAGRTCSKSCQKTPLAQLMPGARIKPRLKSAAKAALQNNTAL